MAIADWVAETTESPIHGHGHDISFSAWDDVWINNDGKYPLGQEKLGTVYRLPSSIIEYCSATGGVKGWKEAEPGIVGIDIDRVSKPKTTWEEIKAKCLPIALADLRTLLARWEALGISRESYAIFFSGCKGFGISRTAEVFGGVLTQVKPITKPQHEEAVLLALKALCGDVPFDTTMAQTLRLWRLPNSRNKKSGLYKVRLAFDEAMSWPLERILGYAAAPQSVGLPLSLVPDAATMSLLQNALVDHDRRLALRPLEPRVHASNALHTQALAVSVPTNSQQPEPDPLVMIEMSRLLKDRKLYGMAPLRHYWNSLEDASTAEHNVAYELIQLGKSDEFINNALWHRPNAKALRNGQHYVNETIKSAHVHDAKRQNESPSGLIGNSPQWLRNHRLWQVLGAMYLRIWDIHLFTALSTDGKTVPEGGQSCQYWLASREIIRANICKGHHPINRAHWMLIKLGMLKLISQGGGKGNANMASVYQACPPTREQAEALVIEAIKAVEDYRSRAKKPRTQRGG